MTVKKTAEGIIFCPDGEMEKALLSGVLREIKSCGRVGDLVLSRAEEGDGVFYLLEGEIGDFIETLRGLDRKLGKGVDAGVNEGFGLRTMVGCMIGSCLEPKESR